MSQSLQGHFAANYVYANSDITPKNRAVCDKMAIKLLISAVQVTLLTMFSLGLMAILPLFTNERPLMVPVVLPFVDFETTRIGYILNFANQVIIAGGGIFIVPGSELVSVIFKKNYSVVAAVIKNTLTEFNDSIKSHKKCSKRHMCRFRNIAIQILDFDRCESDSPVRFNSEL